jgi:deoxyribodipyrimidine photo-lyase
MILMTKILIWYRYDLRLQDHQPLHRALRSQGEVIPFYCFDDRHFQTTSFGFPKTGNFRSQFLLEAIDDLRNSLRKLGSDLVIRSGKPEEIIPDLVRQLQVTDIYYHQEITTEELRVENQLKHNLSTENITFTSFWGSTLYSLENLPFKVEHTPELFTKFRQEIEAKSVVNDPVPSPTKLPTLPQNIHRGYLPTLQDLGLTDINYDPRQIITFKGGETAGIHRLNHYFWEQDLLKNYKETRNGMLELDYSSKFSPWLALGCLSPRYIYHQVQKYERERIKNDSTYWLIFELLWRDYFKFIAQKHGNKIFHLEGLRNIKINWQQDWQNFNLWCSGKTGFPLIDANMQELLNTGFMSNRGRQNVASFLTKNLGIDWRMGAEWFEYLLIDYDVCSNYGNWNYTAGVGNDGRGFRFFNTIKQSKDYDGGGKYIKHWLPELQRVPSDKIHNIWKLLPVEQERFKVRLGVDYPRAIVDLFKSAEKNRQIYDRALN